MSSTLTGLHDARPRQLVLRDLIARSRGRFDQLSDNALVQLLENALYTERKRHERKAVDDDARTTLAGLARAIVQGTRAERIQAGLRLVAAWADEIHGHFNPRVYGLATRVLPRTLNGLLARRAGDVRSWTGHANSRVSVRGDLGLLQTLAREATLILAPTHVSNLDSPLIGLSLHNGGMPPFVYGAGLNLFSNPLMGWWMHRLGAYTVDRMKRATLYKQVLKDYSVLQLTTRHHSLFFPGGTRARSGALETTVKKGLLGTGIVAWQEMIAAGRPDSEVYVVPLTLSFQLVLEANTLINDHLADAGKQRYIITDDEFTQPRRLLSFGSRVMNLDASVVAHFGAPLDCLGRPVSHLASERRAQAEARRRFVCTRDGEVEWDAQRDRVYTDRLASSLVDAWPTYASVMETHLAAYAAWSCLQDLLETQDAFRIVRSPVIKRHIKRHIFISKLREILDRVVTGARQRRWTADLPATAEAVLDTALDRFGRYHRSRAVARLGSDIVVEDPRLCLFYRNRLTFIDRSP
jgi:glycerol-3-phosphate O-acyltransferase